MSAVLQSPQADVPIVRVPMHLAHLSAVMAIEQSIYPFPWTHGNFVDSLAAGHAAHVLRTPAAALAGYSVAMVGVQEMHLLNLTVAAPWQGRGHARALLDALVAQCRRDGHEALWLEVRPSNARAREVYRRYGFEDVGVRRNYYPAAGGRREDACVMRLAIAPEADR
jgi:ribosomal-protein-alanine N-acetyltransferase